MITVISTYKTFLIRASLDGEGRHGRFCRIPTTFVESKDSGKRPLNNEPKGGIQMNQIKVNSGGIVIVRPAGELDHHTADGIKREVSRLIFGGKAAAVIWDLGGLQFMDSAGIGLILGRMRDLGAVDGGTIILNPSPTMRKMFELSGLGNHLMEGSEEEAMKRLGGILHGK